MKPKDSLPVLLVSACDKETAEQFISELIDNDVTEEAGATAGEGRVWRLVNKYYSADVLVRARGDADPPPVATRVEAHVAYFTPQECEAVASVAEACAERRACPRAGVRVAALRAESEGVLGAWAARARYEPVPLLLAELGALRVRDALHAHVWPGLRRLDRPAHHPRVYQEWEESSSGGSAEGSEGEGSSDEGAGVERAEQFAAALGALGAARGPDELGDAERRLRAEQLLAAFCRALGHDLHC